MRTKQGYVYIMTNKEHGTLYVGVTSNLEKRYIEHAKKSVRGFTAKYDLTKLVYFEKAESIEAAITREKQLKHWNRSWKIALIRKANPSWRDLSLELGLDPRIKSEDDDKEI